MSKRFSVDLLPALVSPPWRWLTLLVVAGMLLLARLGFWQLDRLDQRRQENAALLAALAESPLLLNAQQGIDALTTSNDLTDRLVTVSGQYDVASQLLLVQQRFQGRLGQRLLTPLQIDGQQTAILVDRGWIPNQGEQYPGWPDFPEPGEVTVRGYLRPGERLPFGQEATIPDEPQREWFRVDIPGIQAQLSYPLLPYYLLALPEDDLPPGAGNPPYREEPQFDLSEGNHFSYALQWFLFALMLGGGYLYLVWKRLNSDSEG